MSPTGIDTAPAAASAPAPAASPVDAGALTPTSTPASTPAPTPTETTFDGYLDTLFSDTQDAGTDPAVASAEATPPAEAKPAEAPEGTKEGDPGAEGEEQESELDDDVLDLPKVPGKGFYVTERKRDRLFGALRFQQAVEQVMPGVTPEAVKELSLYNTGAQRLIADLTGGNVEYGMNFILSQAKDPAVAASMAEAVVKRLPEVAPQVHERLVTGAIQDKITSLYEQAVKTGNDAMFALAQQLDINVNEKYQTKDDFSPAPKADPKMAALEQEVQQHRQAAESARQEQVRQVVAQTDTAMAQAVEKEIEAALSPVAHLKGKPQWRVIVSDLRDKVKSEARTNDAWKRDFDLKAQQLRQTPTSQARQALVDKVTALARQVARTHRKAVIEEVTGGIAASSQAAHKQHQAAAAKAEPGTGGVPPSTPDALERVRQAKTFDEALDAMFTQ